jgi:T5SS/PEP-CTERM-associated repeat protein
VALLALSTLAAGRPVRADDFGFVGGTTILQGYGAHPVPNCFCGPGASNVWAFSQSGSWGDAQDWQQSGVPFDPVQNLYAHRAPGAGDAVFISGVPAGYLPITMGPSQVGTSPLEPVYGYYNSVGQAGYTGSGGFSISGVSGTVAELTVSGTGNFTPGGLTVTDQTTFEAVGGEFIPVWDTSNTTTSGAILLNGHGGATLTVGGSMSSLVLNLIAETDLGAAGSSSTVQPVADAGTLTFNGAAISGDLTRVLPTTDYLGSPLVASTERLSIQPIAFNNSTLNAKSELDLVGFDPGLFANATGVTTLAAKTSTIKAGSVKIATGTPGNPGSSLAMANLNLDNGSTLTVSGLPNSVLIVGDTGYGVLKATNGSTINSGQTIVGNAPNATGNVIVDNSRWNISDFLTVGNLTGAAIHIQNGGKVYSTGPNANTFIAALPGSDGSTVNVNGQGSLWQPGGYVAVGQGAKGNLIVADGGSVLTGDVMYVGDAGTGVLTISGGGTVTTSATGTFGTSSTVLAALPGSQGTMTITDSGSTLESKGDMSVGYAGAGTATIGKGGVLTVDGAVFRVGRNAGSTGVLTVSDAGSSVTIDSGTAYVGFGGKGAVTINSGASFSAENTNVGGQAGAQGTITVDGAGTTADFGSAKIGDGAFAQVTISKGAQAQASDATLGEQAGANGNLTIQGQGSSFTVDGDLTIGKDGMATLRVTDSAQLTTDGLTIGENPLANSQLQPLTGFHNPIDGAVFDGGAQVQAGDLTVGAGGYATMTVGGGASVTASGDVTLAESAGSEANVWVGSPSAATLTADSLTVGGGGHAELRVTDGSSVTTSGDTTVGDEAGSQGRITLGGAGAATLTVGGDLTVGGEGGAGDIEVNPGSRLAVAGHSITIGEGAGSLGSITLSGGQLSFGGELVVGGAGTGLLQLQEGASNGAVALPAAVKVTLGESAGSVGKLVLDGTGTTLQTADLTIGDKGGGQAMLTNGAALAAAGPVSVGDGLSGALSILSIDSTALLNVSNTVTVGGNATAMANVAGGGRLVSVSDLTIGDNPNGDGTVTVSGVETGAPSPVRSSIGYGGDLVVGNLGTGRLQVSDGGLVAPTKGGSGAMSIGAQQGGAGVVVVGGADTVSHLNATLMAQTLGVGGSVDAAGGSGRLQVDAGGYVGVGSLVNTWAGGVIDVSGGGLTIGGGASPAAPASGTVTVLSGGTLQGTGTIVGTVVNSGGTVHPGHSPGVLTITGNYVQGASGQLLLSVGPASYSQLKVSGAVTLNGGTIVLQSYQGGQINVGDQYQFIQAAGGITGQVGQVVAPTGFTTLAASLSGGTLMLTAVHVAGSFGATATTPNQHSLAAALDAAGMDTVSAIVPLVNALSQLDPSQLPATFDTLSPEGLVGVQVAAFQAQHGFVQTVADADRAPGASDDQPVAVRGAGGGRLWFSGYGAGGHFSGQPGLGIAGDSTRGSGFTVGADHRLGQAGLLGFAIGPSLTDFTVAGRGAAGRVRGLHLALYGALASGPFYASGLFTYARLNDTAQRQAAAIGLAGSLSDAAHGDLLGGRLELGWRATTARTHLTAFLAFEGASLEQNASGETASGLAAPFALAIPDQRTASEVLSVGFKADRSFALAGATLTPSLQLAYGHEFDDRRAIEAAFLSAPATRFETVGASPGPDSVHVGLSLDLRLSSGAAVFIKGETDQARRSHVDAGYIGVRFNW